MIDWIFTVRLSSLEFADRDDENCFTTTVQNWLILNNYLQQTFKLLWELFELFQDISNRAGV